MKKTEHNNVSVCVFFSAFQTKNVSMSSYYELHTDIKRGVCNNFAKTKKFNSATVYRNTVLTQKKEGKKRSCSFKTRTSVTSSSSANGE